VRVAPRGGVARLGVVGAAAGRGARGRALPGTPCCSSGSGCGRGSGPDTILVGEGNGEFRHSLRPVWGEAFPAQVKGKNIKLPQCLTKYHAMKTYPVLKRHVMNTYGGVERAGIAQSV
jgi:hypothetical protein